MTIKMAIEKSMKCHKNSRLEKMESCWAVEQRRDGSKKCNSLSINVLNEDKHCPGCKFYKTKAQKAQDDYYTEKRLEQIAYIRKDDKGEL